MSEHHLFPKQINLIVQVRSPTMEFVEFEKKIASLEEAIEGEEKEVDAIDKRR